MVKLKVYLFPEKLFQLSNVNMGLEHSVLFFCFLIVRLNPDFNCCNSFALSSVDKVITENKVLYQLL